MKTASFLVLLLINSIAFTQAIQFQASFLSKETTPSLVSNDGTPGISTNQQLSGASGSVQISVDPGVIPIRSKLVITLWNGTTV